MTSLELISRERRAEHYVENACERMEDDLRRLRDVADTSKMSVTLLESVREFLIQAETNILAARLTLESTFVKTSK